MTAQVVKAGICISRAGRQNHDRKAGKYCQKREGWRLWNYVKSRSTLYRQININNVRIHTSKQISAVRPWSHVKKVLQEW